MPFLKAPLALVLTTVISLTVAPPVAVSAQAPPPQVKQEPNGGQPAPLASTAQALYEDAEGYVRRKFDEFEKKNVPYSRNLEAVTYHEQRELAMKHVATIAARGASLRGLDLYYTGRLYALAGKGAEALGALRRFLAEENDGEVTPEVRQKARAVFVQHAVEQNLTAEAEKVLADYARNEPRTPAEAHRMNSALAQHFHKRKEFARAAAFAREAYHVSLGLARAKTSLTPSQRADNVYGAGAFLVDALVKSNRRADAIGVIQEMRRLSLEMPSARLYGNATVLLLDNGEPLAAPPLAPADANAAADPNAAPPEIKVKHWIDQQPARLADLRGRVVLLDFWATWCGPCRFTIPKLNALHKKYSARGLTIIGLTEFYGNAEGRELTPPEELNYLRRFKQQREIGYGFGVAEDKDNDTNYGVTQMPTAVLIDRRGRVRFITVGASDIEARALAETIEKLINEQ